jgi:GR25 family glycosyltransferase involved in LPS biosynthesis
MATTTGDNLINTVSDIKHCLYINLESRVDRKEHIESQLKSIGIVSARRFNAIKLKNGRVGCSMSHLKCLEIAKKNDWPYVMICEDDLLFLDSTNFIKRANKFFSLHGNRSDTWNVLLIAGNNVPPYSKVDDTCIRVSHCQTTTCYIVKKSYYNILIGNIRAGIERLIKEPERHAFFAIDKFWIQLQRMHTWYMLAPVVAVQREDYSDIEHRKTNYENIMKDLDKTNLIKNNHTSQTVNSALSISSINTIPTIPTIPMKF